MQRAALSLISAPLRRARRSAAAVTGVAALCAGVLVSGIPSGPVAAQESRIGFVNTERVLRESNPAKASQQKLEQEFSKREKAIQDSAAKLKELTAKLERDAAVMPEAERVKRQREAAELERDIQRRQREFREDLNQRRNEELAGVVERANRVIRQIAEAEKFDIIFQEAVYAAPRIDITDKVLKALNAAPAPAR